MKTDKTVPEQPAKALLAWFSANRRDLPWREEPRNPYHAWISEIMLQQTQVQTVIGYFNRWMDQFPSIPDLAKAPLDAVLKAWEGLGYYSRARNLHKTACLLMETYDGKLPRRSKELLKLPGIGPYTAAAIASLAFGEDVVAVDGNIWRIVARVFTLKNGVTQKEAARLLVPHYPPGAAGRINEALMELGALCCTPAKPSCEVCPLRTICQGLQTGHPEDFPQTRKKKLPPRVRRVGLLILKEKGLYLIRHPEEGMLGGLWGIPLVEGKETPAESTIEASLGNVSHIYTHFRIDVTPLVVREGPEGIDNGSEGRFVPFDEISRLALSTLDHKILKRLKIYLEDTVKSGDGEIRLTGTGRGSRKS